LSDKAYHIKGADADALEWAAVMHKAKEAKTVRIPRD